MKLGSEKLKVKECENKSEKKKSRGQEKDSVREARELRERGRIGIDQHSFFDRGLIVSRRGGHRFFDDWMVVVVVLLGNKEEEPQEIVLKVDMHCKACAKKVASFRNGFEGVEDVRADYKAGKVVVKGKTADPMKVCERIRSKSGRKVEIMSPLPKPPEEDDQNEDQKEEDKKEEVATPTPTTDLSLSLSACILRVLR
ncbi:hypothetical protein Ancab_033360 [Ancistrocladus abbreviatus]